MGPMSNTMLLPRTGPQMPNMGPNMGPMSNPSLLPPRPGSSGAQMPNMMLYQSAGGDSGPPSNDLYRSYEQFAGGVDPRMYESPMQHANVADQFVHSFGGFGPHGQAKGVGVGIRVEFNQARDLVVARVNEGGSAQRDGTVRVGDILLAIGQTLVEGKTLVQLRPFMIGPRGSLVTLTFKRQVHGSGEFSEYTIELMRGDSLYFLQVENQVAESKLEIFRSNINEVKVEMDNMRTVLAQAQGRVKMTESEMQTMQTRYRQMQNAIEKCIGDIADERQMQANLRDNLQRIESENPYKEQLGAYHEKLTRVEATLGEVMSELGGEHGASCKLLTELDQEHSIAKLIAEKIRNHEGLVARSSEQTTSIEDVLAQRHEEMEHLKNQIAETQAEARRIEQEFETELADSNASQARVALAQVLSFWRCNERFFFGGACRHEEYEISALDVPMTLTLAVVLQKERADLEVQLDCVRAAVMEAESEMEREVQKGKRLVEKQELVRIVADKRQQASGGLHTVMEREDERKEDMLRETRAERRRLRDGASHRQQDLRMQIDTIKDINVQLQNKILVTITEHESAKHNLKFETKISEDKLEAERTRTDATKDDFEKLAQQIREAQQHMLEANDATAECARDEEKHVADISRVHRSVAEMDRLFHHLFQVSKTREDYLRGLRHEHDNYLHSVQMTVDESKNNMEEIRGAEARTQQEMQRCRKAMQKIAELHSEFSNRKSFFQGKSLEHLRDTEHVFQHHHNGLREQLAALSALNPDNFFKFSQVTNNTISDALLNVQKIMQDYATARARFDDGRTTLSDELQTGHQQHLLPRRQYARDMQEVDWGHGMQQAASAAICVYGTSSSYTDQLVARSPAILPSQRQSHSSKEMVDGPITTFQLFSPPSRCEQKSACAYV